MDTLPDDREHGTITGGCCEVGICMHDRYGLRSCIVAVNVDGECNKGIVDTLRLSFRVYRRFTLR